MSKRVIFLDIDGVLNDAATDEYTPAGFMGIDGYKVKLLHRIVEATDASIVLTSTWKTEWSKYEELLAKDGAYLNIMLAEEGLQILDKTTDQVIDRGAGISRWLNEHPDIESWAVVDDEVFPDFKEHDILPHLVKTNFYLGLTQENVEQCIKILNDGGSEQGVCLKLLLLLPYYLFY